MVINKIIIHDELGWLQIMKKFIMIYFKWINPDHNQQHINKIIIITYLLWGYLEYNYKHIIIYDSKTKSVAAAVL